MRQLTVYGFYRQYESLWRSARPGSAARAAYGFLSDVLKRVLYLSQARSAVEARLVVLRREVGRVRGFRHARVLDQIAIFEHFLEEIRGRDD